MIVDVINLTKKNTLCRAEVADSFLRRAIGLMFARPDRGAALLIKYSSVLQSRTIHSFFMSFSLDLVFIDEKKRVTEIKTLDPWGFTAPEKPCQWVLEVEKGSLPPGAVESGNVLEFRPVQGPG